MPSPPAARSATRAALWLLLAASLLPFLPALGGGFVYDDFPAIVKNPRVQAGGIAELFASGSYWREEVVGYRPLASLSFKANLAIPGAGGWGFHAINLLLHAVNVLLVAGLARRHAGADSAAAPLLAGLLFAVHPAQTEVVAGITPGRAELLSVTLILLALRLVGASRVGLARAAAAAAVYLAALLAKESALPLPALVFLLDGGARRRLRPIHYAPFAAALLVYLAMRASALGRLAAMMPSFIDNPLPHGAASAFLPGVLRVLSEYGRIVFYPARLSADYGFNAVPLPTGLLSAAILPGAAIAIGLVAIAAAPLLPQRLRGRIGSQSSRLALCLLATLAIPLHLVAPVPALCAERFLYLPMVFIALLASRLVHGAGGRGGRARLAVAAAVIVALAGRAAVRAADWRSELALFGSSVRATPGSARLHDAYGLALRHRGDEEAAEVEFRRAIEIHPDYGRALVNLGNVELRRGQTEAAIARYERALQKNPAYTRARWNLAVALEQRGDIANAARQYAQIRATDPGHFDARLRLGEILAAAGNTADARQLFEEARAIRPSDERPRRALERLDGVGR